MMKSVFSCIKLSHVLFASLFWCIGVFLFVGNSFGSYEQLYNRLSRTRREATLTHIKQIVQSDIDKGASLPRIQSVDVLLSRFALGDEGILSVFVFGQTSGKILFSSLASQAGIRVPAEWLVSCAQADTFFSKEFTGKKMLSLPVLDSMNAVAGCVSMEYKTLTYDEIHSLMVAKSIQTGVRLSLSGIVFLFACYAALILFFKVQGRWRFWGTVGMTVAVLVCFGGTGYYFMHANDGFREAVSPELTLKSETLAKILQSQVEKALQAGVPLKSLVQADSFLDSVRLKNKEIAFILITDETGRVLYESGEASKAFATDKKTGRVRLRDEFLNSAQPLRTVKGTLGWVQIGVYRGGKA